jgi:hypothetical protein
LDREPSRREKGWVVTDEIELLRLFRDEMPGPSTDAWARARSAMAAARSEHEPVGHQRRPSRRRLVMIAAAAAGVLVIGGASYGLTAGLGGSGRSAGAPGANGRPQIGAGLTVVSGCPGLEVTSGTLDGVYGTSLVLTASGGAPVTVTTSGSTMLSHQVTGSVSDIADGAQVIVGGTGSGGTITAQNISVAVVPKLPRSPAQGHRRGFVRFRRGGAVGQGSSAIGTVTDVRSGGFTVITAGGVRVPVTTSGSTTVLTLAGVSLSQLKAGDLIVAVGSGGPDGTLAAATVEQGPRLPQTYSGNGAANLPRLGCSSSDVAASALLSAG